MQVAQSIHDDNYRVYNEVVAKLKKDLEEERSSKKKVFFIYNKVDPGCHAMTWKFSREEAQKQVDFLNCLEVSFNILESIEEGHTEDMSIRINCLNPYEFAEVEIN